jgi:short-subunit dehydrogenase
MDSRNFGTKKMLKTAVVTGATKGLGRAIAEVFAENGFDVCVCARTELDLYNMQATWATQFPSRRLHTFQADLSQTADVMAFSAFVRSTWHQLDVLVNNAGLYLPGTLMDKPTGTLEHLMALNLYSAYYLTEALLPMMVPFRKGYVFNMCSIASFLAYSNAALYSISKFALLGFSRSLREETKPYGIKVTAIMPGATWSDAWEGVALPPDRLMQPSDVAKAVWGCYTLSDAAVVEELLLRPQLGDL